MIGQLELLLDSKAIIGEGPCWDAQKKLLYWVDITGEKLHIYNPETNTDRAVEVGQYIGAVVPRKSGGLIIALQKGFYFFDEETGRTELIYDPEGHLPDNRFNDGKCDAAGRFWAGTMSCGENKNSGTLYCLDTDLSVRAAIGNVTISNGIGWSPDNKVMYYIDTPTKQVAAYDYDLEKGGISNKRIVVQFSEGNGAPDGMCVDEEGMLWVAEWNGFRVGRWNPETGMLLDEIRVPAAKVSSCAFGGCNMDELYITTARAGIDKASLEKQPYAGGLFRIKMGVRGLETFKFGG